MARSALYNQHGLEPCIYKYYDDPIQYCCISDSLQFIDMIICLDEVKPATGTAQGNSEEKHAEHHEVVRQKKSKKKSSAGTSEYFIWHVHNWCLFLVYLREFQYYIADLIFDRLAGSLAVEM